MRHAGRFIAVLALLLASCGAPAPPPAPTVAERLAGGALLPLPATALADVEPAVSGAFEAARKAITDRAAELAGPATDLAAAYGELAQLAHAYRLFTLAEAAYRNAEALAPERGAWPYLRALTHLDRGELEAAAAALEQARERMPDDVPTLVRLGALYLDRGTPERALPLLEQARVGGSGAEAVSHYHLGRARLASGDTAAAIVHFETALATEPGATALHAALRDAYLRRGDRDRASAHGRQAGSALPALPDPLQAAMAQRRGSASALAQRAASALGRKEYERAAALFEAAISADPQNLEARHDRASALARDGRQAEALAAFAALVETVPERALLRFDYGTLLGQAGRLEEAIAQLETAVALEPGFKEAHHNLGSAHARAGRYAAAYDAFSAALELDPHHRGARFQRAAVLVDMGRQAEARRELAALVSAEPDHVEARLRLAHLYYEVGETAEAIAQFRAVTALAPERVAVWFNLATLLAARGEHTAALAPWQEVLRREPGNAAAQLGEAEALLAHGDHDGAWQRLEALAAAGLGDPALVGRLEALRARIDRERDTGC